MKPLIWADQFSTADSALIIDVQAKLDPDQNQLTATHMQILHTLKGSLYLDVDTPPATWLRPDDGAVVVQCLLYLSFSTSLSAPSVVILGKQWFTLV